VTGVAVPMLMVSPTQINAQLPYQTDGNVTVVLHTPGGVSDNFNMTIQANAPSVFRNGVAGNATDVATVVRSSNGQLVTLANPIHRGDSLVIYLTGLGKVSPSLEAGQAAPSDPPATVVVEPQVTLAGVGLPVSFAGLSPGQVGVYQINVRVPDWVPSGLGQILTIAQGTGSTSLEVRVVE
jgi:uncharacterized protein (TIGR03437 family)